MQKAISQTDMENSSTGIKLISYIIIILYLSQVIYSIISQQTYFADGGYVFLKVIESGAVFDPGNSSRTFGHYLTQLPLLISVNLLKIRNVELLSYTWSLGLYLPQFLSLMICYYIAKKRSLYFLIFPLIGLFGISYNVCLTAAESLVISNLFWPIFFYILLVDEPSSIDVVIILLLGTVFSRSYESSILLGIGLISSLMFKLTHFWPNLSSKAKIAYICLGAILIKGIVVAGYAIATPIDPGNKKLFLQSVQGILHHYQALLSLVFIAVIMLALISEKFHASPAWPTTFLVLTFLSGFLCLISIFAPGLNTLPNRYFEARSFPVYTIPFVALLCYVVCIRGLTIAEACWNKVAMLTMVLIAGQLICHLAATAQWHGFREVFKRELSANHGLVSFERTDLGKAKVGNQLLRLFIWDWTNPTMSILWGNGGDIQTIIANPLERHGGWEPFDASSVNTFPNLSRYGYSYKKFEQALWLQG